MRFYRSWVALETSDKAEAVGICVELNGTNDDDVLLYFPDRTPEKHIEAIADAINAALKAAREVEGLGRD